jgi:hypothetical protein
MAPVQALANRLAGGLGAPRVATCENSKAIGRGGVKLMLRRVSGGVSVAFLQPVADGQVEDRRNGELA